MIPGSVAQFVRMATEPGMGHLFHPRSQELHRWNVVGVSGDQNCSVVVVVNSKTNELGDESGVNALLDGAADFLVAMRTMSNE